MRRTHNREERPRLIEYIVKQEEHHRKVSFEDELRALVEEAGLEFDNRYLP
jgi:putative transposase